MRRKSLAVIILAVKGIKSMRIDKYYKNLFGGTIDVNILAAIEFREELYQIHVPLVIISLPAVVGDLDVGIYQVRRVD